MKKERMKTIVLILLIISSLFLTSQIWFSKKLWSEDYNFFVNGIKPFKIQTIIRKVFPGKKETVEFSIENLAYSPQDIIVSFGGIRSKYTPQDKEYKNFLEELFMCLNALFKVETEHKYVSVDTEEWLSSLKSKSFYMRFSTNYKIKQLGQLFGVHDTPISSYIKDIEEIIIVPGDSATNNVFIYMKDFENGTIIKFSLSYDKTNLNKKLSEYQEKASAETRYKFSFELDYHKKTEFTNFTIDKEVLIPLNSLKQQIIRSNNPIKSDFDIKNILKTFKYSVNTLRRYVEMDNTIVFIENYETLKIHPEGIIEYNVIGDGKGVQLNKMKNINEKDTDSVSSIKKQQTNKDINNYSMRESLDIAVNFIKGMHGDNDQDIKLVNINEEANKQGSYEFEFIYSYNGLPIKNIWALKNEGKTGTKTSGRYEPAIKVKIVNGSIKNYYHFVRDYNIEKQVEVKIPIPNVLDNMYKEIDTKDKDIKIKDIYLTYDDDDKAETMQPQWAIKLDEYEGTITIMADIK